ncbi:MAG: isochorismatase family protein [Desulfomonilaceae bacterium]
MLNPDQVVLVVVDLQEKLSKAMYCLDSLLSASEKIIKGSNILSIPIIWTEQNPKGLGSTLEPFANLMNPDLRVPKLSFSCCGEPNFANLLASQDRRQILLMGIESHVCVYQTGIDLIDLGYEVQVVTDAVSSRTQENRILGIERLKSSGAKVTSSEMALFEMLKIAEGPKFKDVLKVVK